MQDSDKKLALELLIKAKVYRVVAGAFALVGLVIFIFIYMQFYQGDYMKALHDPFIIVLVIFPFAPSIFFSLNTKKAERQLHKIIAANQAPE